MVIAFMWSWGKSSASFSEAALHIFMAAAMHQVRALFGFPCLQRKHQRKRESYLLICASKWFLISQGLLKADVELEILTHFEAGF